MTEARVLSVLLEPGTIVDIVDRLAENGDRLDDSSVYLALRRMTERNLVARRNVRRQAADGKQRDIGEYEISAAGKEALRAWASEARPVISRLAPALGW